MPHLDAFGISETFALMEAAHRHWQLLEVLFGNRSRHWRDPTGQRAYASIIYSDITFGSCRGQESDDVELRCRLTGVDLPFTSSETTFHVNGELAVRVVLLSVLVVRTGDNTKFVRGSLGASVDPFGKPHISELRELFKTRAPSVSDMVLSREHPINYVLDFNNAKFIYFATFCRLLTQADNVDGHHRAVSRREVWYSGNANYPDVLLISVAGEGRYRARHSIARRSDETVIVRSCADFVHV